MSAHESAESQVTTQCGHEVPRTDTVAVPSIGRLCRSCHTPIPLARWESVIDTTTVHHRTGEKSTYSTWLVGLDEVGRGIYFDERDRSVHILVPKYHHAFDADVDGDERPVRKRPPKHCPGRGDIVNAPDNGVLVTYETISFDITERTQKALCSWIIEETIDGSWTALSESALEALEHCTNFYNHRSFPVENAHEVIEQYDD
jgi:hypothetical protein